MPIKEPKNLGELCDQIGHELYELDNEPHTNTSIENLVKRAVRVGYLKSLKDWAIWRDGEEVVGCGVHTYKEVVKSLMK